ncbi:MAG: acyltransferase [Terrisporobacter othiniensis]|uniref:acyltransferase family protein n=1 Tax=Terrisporobacter othiniensis TaxID=1577792 RepID=UPI0029154738|nr:acyltransferase [Terrisporobacter othiniensis]MDU6983201.1 acyltransferase [Terrisporobacter othiniensis]
MYIKSNVRYASMDMLKAICAFFIVCIHTFMYIDTSSYFITIIRFSVPIFFMITGYNYSSIKCKWRKYISNMLKLICISNLIYFLYGLIKIMVNNDSVLMYINEIVSLKSILKLVLFNESPFMWHLWYLFAILYVLLIYRYIENNKLEKILYFLTPLLLILDLILGKYSILLFGRSTNHVFLIRNFLFVGLPYFCIGVYMNMKEDKIKSSSINNKKIIILFIISCITCIVERMVLTDLGANAPREQYISTTIMSIIIFIFVIKNKTFMEGTLLQKIGKEYSTWIYILHPLVILGMNYLLKENIINRYSFIYSLYIYIVTIMIIYIYKKFIKLKEYI